ncbi:hypothetical protein CsSME_00031004 [Camellia sinensis var. sinensis]
MDIDKGLVPSNPDLVIGEEPLVSLAPTGRVGKKWKKIGRNQKETTGSGELPVGVKRSLIGEEVIADEGFSKGKQARLDALMVSSDSTVVAVPQSCRQP